LAKLAKRDPDGVLDALLACRNPERRLFLIYALGRSGRPEFFSDLMPLTMSDDPDERAEAIRALGSLRNPDAKLAVIMALDDPAWVVRAQAAQAAGKIGLTCAVPRLVGLLNEDEWWVRYRAAWALWDIGEEGRAKLLPSALSTARAVSIAELVRVEAAGKGE
jgi:HEAT repeat protein